MRKFNNIWVYIDETNKQTLRVSEELLVQAKELAKEAGMLAIPVRLAEKPDSSDAILKALKAAVIRENPFAIFFGSTPLGKELSSGLTASLDLGIASDCSNVIYRKSENDLMFIRPTFDGKLNASITLKTYPQVASFPAGVFPLKGNSADFDLNKYILEFPNDLASVLGNRLVEFIEDQELSNTDIENAEVLVAGGRGVGSAEGFELLRELARLLGGNIAASRGAVDDGYISKDYQVGATGKTVAPKLYIACGISGAPPHTVGMKDSELIVAINTNGSEPIFDVAHYGIVGDLHQVLPELIAILKEARS